MTICIGIVARDGIVVASDREEGDGYLKNDTGKILTTFRGRVPIGWIGVTGAGDGPSIDEVSASLSDSFCEEGERDASQAKESLMARHRAYYKENVLPFSVHPQTCPDYSLIVGCFGGGFRKALFFTSKLAFNEVKDYQAVGIGASIANHWLSRLYENMPVIYAVKLAAYVIFQVKGSVGGGCGLGTDIIMLRGKDLIPRVNPELIRRWEGMFRLYPSLERAVFGYCVGLESDQLLIRTHPDKNSINANMDKLREWLTLPDAEKPESGE